MRKVCFVFVLFSMLLFCYAAIGAEKTHWGYTGDIGPEHWAELSEEFEMCAKGKNQSPTI